VGELSPKDFASEKKTPRSDNESPHENTGVASAPDERSYVMHQIGAGVTDESCEALLRGRAAAIVDTVIDRALAGNMPAAKMVLERILPDPRNRLVSFDLRDITCVDDALAASGDIIAAVAQGKINLNEAEAVTRLLQNYIDNNSLREFAQRLSSLEEIVKIYA
jgi:hypothetical protein